MKKSDLFKIGVLLMATTLGTQPDALSEKTRRNRKL